MMKNILVLLGASLLAGCGATTTLVTTKQHIVVKPSAALYQCKVLTNIPNPDTLTDLQVARLIQTLYSNNRQCAASLNAVRGLLNTADQATMPTANEARSWLKTQR